MKYVDWIQLSLSVPFSPLADHCEFLYKFSCFIIS